MKPVNVRLQNCSPQMGIEENPVFCWQYGDADRGQRQSACRLRISEGEKLVYDSGWLRTPLQNALEAPAALKRHARYTVRVEAENKEGVRETSEPFTFVSGVGEKWLGKWISAGTDAPFCAGKDFRIGKKLRAAYISCAGSGQYELTVNGQSPDRSVLNGSWTDFDKRIHYRTFEITELLRKGENTLCLEVGNGWYCAPGEDGRHFYTRHMGYRPFGQVLAAIAEVTLQYEDGETEVFGSDGNWRTKRSAVTHTNIYGSEDCDARRETADWENAAKVLEAPLRPKGRLVPMCYPPVVIKRTYAGKRVRVLKDQSVIYDLGQNMAGIFEVTVHGKRGCRLRIFPVEKLDALGNPWKTVESFCTYTLKGGAPETWRMKFTYGAGRYLWISPEDGTELPEICAVRGGFVTSGAGDAGGFFCSDHRYMQLHDLILKAVESNLNHVHTDCPTIERLGWQEPNHLMAPSIFYVKDAETLWEKIAQDQRDSQYEKGEYDRDSGKFPHEYREGLLPSIAPRYAKFLYDGGEGSFWDIIPWGSSILMGAWEVLRFTGNQRLLEKNYETAKRYADYLYQKYLDYPKLYGKPDNLHFLCHGLGDWGIEQNRGESRENIETAYLYRDLKLLEETAARLGKKEDERQFGRIAQELLEEYNRALLKWNPLTGEWAYDSWEKTGLCPTQATQAIPLQFCMVPEDKRESVKRSFLHTCREGRLRTGEIGLPYILRTLGDMGEADLVQTMFFQEYHPSYGRFIESGETTLPEFWRDDARSRNHDMMGAALEWLYRYMAGISSEDGFCHIRIEPRLPEKVGYLACTFRPRQGEIRLSVTKTKDRLHAEISIPVNTEGTVKLNGEERQIEGGEVYRI